MMLSTWMRLGSFSSLAAVAVLLGGCSGTGATGPDAGKTATPAGDACAVAGWCTEHGVPEEICAQCNTKLAAGFKQKGDWCNEHSRPESQCFLCNPKLAAQFADEYETKHGRKPPTPSP